MVWETAWFRGTASRWRSPAGHPRPQRRQTRRLAIQQPFTLTDTLGRYDVTIGDAYEEVPDGLFDRVMLDLPEPWRVVPNLPDRLEVGAVLVAYTPSITQAVQVRQTLDDKWAEQRTLEVLHRTWHIEGMAVRPDHRMVAHTAFLTVARFIG